MNRTKNRFSQLIRTASGAFTRNGAPRKYNIHRISFALTILTVLAVVTYDAAAGSKFSDWSAPVNLGPVINSEFRDFGPAISKDGLSLYFGSSRPGGFGATDIWVSQRESMDEPFGPPINLGPNINTSFSDNIPSFSRDGHWMFFNSNRSGGFGGGNDIWVSYRQHVKDDFGWQPPVNLGPNINTSFADQGVGYFENDEAGAPLLFFASNRTGGAGSFDIYVSTLGADGSFGPASLVAELNTPHDDQRGVIRSDGLEIILHSNRPGSLGGFDLWASTRPSVLDTWSPPVNLGVVNSTSNEQTAYLSSDRRTLFFASDRPGGFGDLDLYVATREKANGQ